MKLQSSLKNLLALTGTAMLIATNAQAASGTWDTDSAGNWTDITKWTGDAAYAFGADSTATFGNFITVNRIVTLDTGITIGNITASDTTHDYTISGANILTLDRTDLTAPTIDVTTSGRTLTISSVVAGNDGLIKSGAGTLLLSGLNTFTGGISLGGGTIKWNETALTLNNNNVTFTANSTFETFRNTNPTSIASNITLNSGVTATFSAPSNAFAFSTTGVLAGGNNTVVTANGSSASGVVLNFLNTANTFTGQYLNPAGGATIGGFNVGSLADSAGAGKISMGSGTFTLTGSAPVTLNNRVFELLGTTTGAGLSNNSAYNSNTLTVNTNLLVTGVGAKTFTLGGTNAGANLWSTNIADGVGSAITVAKTGTGAWRISGNMSNTGGLSIANGGPLTLSGTNTYSGLTSFTGVGAQLILAGSQAASANTTFRMNTSDSSASSTIRFLDDTGNVNGGTATFAGTYQLRSNNTAGVTNTFFVGNNNTANGGTSSGTTTGSTLTIGTLNWNTVAAGTTKVGEIPIQGVNGYRLQINNVILHNGSSMAAAQINNTTFYPTSANVTLGAVTMAAGNTVSGAIPNLVLDGTSSDNRITGAISNASDVGTTLRPVNLVKSSTSIWTLSGTNTYTGTTTVSGGRLLITGNSSAATGNVSVTGGALGGNAGSLGGAVTVSSTGGINLADGSVGSLTLGSTLNITGAAGANNINFDLGNTTGTSDSLVVAGATTVTTTGAAVINLNQLGGSAGRTATTYTLIGGAGTLGATDFAKFSLATTAAYGQTYALTNTGDDLQVVATNVTSATPAAFWAGGGNNWSTTTNWRTTLAGGGAVTGAPDYQTNVTFSTTTPVAANLTTNVLDTDFNINSLTLTTASGNVTIGGTTRMLTIEAAAVNGNTAGNGIDSQKTSGTNTISAKVGLASSQTWTVATGGTLAVSGAISDFGAGYTLTKAGGGTLNLTGATTYTGGNIITGGVLSASAASAGAFNAGPLSLSGGGRLTVAGGNIASASQVSVGTGGGSISVGGNQNYTTSGKLTGSGTLTLVDVGGGGAKTFNFNSVENDFTGGIILNGGAGLTLNVNSLADSANNIVFNATGNTHTTPFNYGAAAIAPLSLATRAIEINGGSFTGGYTATITNNNTSKAISIGTNLVATGSGAKTLALSAVAGPTNIFSGNITNGTGGGSIALSKTGAGTWLLNGTNTYTGGTTITGGTLILSNTAALGAAGQAVTLNANGVMLDLHTDTSVNAYNVTVSNNAGIEVDRATAGDGIVNTLGTLSMGAFTLSVTTSNGHNVNANTNYGLTFGATTLTGNATFSVANNGSGIGTLTLGAIGETGGGRTLTKTGAGILTISGASAYTGATTISAGTMEVTGSFASSGITNNAALVFNSASAQSYANAISGTGSVTKSGAGTLTLGGTNTYGGVTTVNNGTLEVSAGNINGTSSVAINGGEFKYGSATALTKNVALAGGTFRYNTLANFTGTFTHTAGTIAGTNWNGSLDNQTIAINEFISPGNSPGAASTGAQTWAGGGTYLWEINSTADLGPNVGTAGLDPGWDLINGSGVLTISATSGSKFTIDITSLNLSNGLGIVHNFDDASNYNWLIADFASITGFDADAFNLDATGFTNTYTGLFGIAQGGGLMVGDASQIYLTYTAIPEPGVALLGGLSLLGLVLRRRR